ncbi:hypothetical protein, partial [Pseudomonas aeruginosa]|uniref:hypothetical protein n=1 Tax=Pseudomonas aeruginosa TaxID=287 RepID=UPI0021F0EA35
MLGIVVPSMGAARVLQPLHRPAAGRPARALRAPFDPPKILFRRSLSRGGGGGGRAGQGGGGGGGGGGRGGGGARP